MLHEHLQKNTKNGDNMTGIDDFDTERGRVAEAEAAAEAESLLSLGLRLLRSAPGARLRLAFVHAVLGGGVATWLLFLRRCYVLGGARAVLDELGPGVVGAAASLRIASMLRGADRFDALRVALAAAPAPRASVRAIERRARHLTLAFVATYGSVLLLMTLSPWLGPRDATSQLPVLQLPFLLPLDPATPIGFALTYLWHCIAGSVYILAMPVTEWGAAALLAHVALRLRTVAEALHALCRLPPELVTAELRRAIRMHQHALGLVEQANAFLATALGVQVLSSSTIFCCLVYRITRSDATPDEVAGKILLMTPIALQLFSICVFGEVVRQQGAAVAAAAWASGWERESECAGTAQLRRDLAFVLLRAQKLPRVRGLYADISLRTFREVMKISYSFFNLLTEVE